MNRELGYRGGLPKVESGSKMTGIILAGGENNRMGLNKALLRLNSRTIIEGIVEVINPIFWEILVVTNSPEDFKFLKLKSVRDITSTRGSLTGIYSGLVHSQTHYSFFFACDMPFIKPDLIKFMMGESQGYDVVIPQGKEGLEPLHAIYSKHCLEPIKNRLSRRDFKIVDFFPQVKVKLIDQSTITRFDPDQIGFFNINTRADYLRALQMEEKYC
jgi:molybdopterin-guanine dinucleotide biosynthesis protein A